MQTNLLLFIENSPVNVDELTKEVYKTLKQTDSLSAEVIFVSEEEIKSLNSDNRNINEVTDVLSFPTLDGHRNTIIKAEDYPLDVVDNRVFLGSIAVCVKRAKEQAVEYGHSEEREITYLICHGLLHLFGYDHMIDTDKKEMRNLEENIMNNIGITR